MAAVEIGRRLARAELPRREPLNRPASVARYVNLRYGASDQEVMGALFVDIRNRLLGEREIFRGTLNRAAVEPREILKEGLIRGAAGVVLFHTHPSGDPSPIGRGHPVHPADGRGGRGGGGAPGRPPDRRPGRRLGLAQGARGLVRRRGAPPRGVRGRAAK